MVKIINTGTDVLPTGATEGLWVYNALDCGVTLEVLHVLKPKLNENTQHIYDFERELQGPILEMNCRGVKIDQDQRSKMVGVFEARLRKLEDYLYRLLTEGLGLPEKEVTWLKKEKGVLYEKHLWGSNQRLQKLFYETLRIPPIKDKGRVTVDVKAMEKLQSYFYAEPIVRAILAVRDLNKKLGFLRTGIDSDGRLRTTFSIAGTDTGRLASYGAAFGTGTNNQNVTPELRIIFEADPGMKFLYVDLEQAESRAVGAILWNLFHDGKYLDFCESGDLHTNVAKMTFKHLPWTGDPKRDKEIAKQPFYRIFSFRDGTKRLGHGSNYHGQPPQMARETHIPLGLVQAFQKEYFSEFPRIPDWHESTRKRLMKDGFITSLLGRQRWFFGRRYENSTLNAAIAYDPQSTVADYMNKGLLTVWKEIRRGRINAQLLLQVHDALLIQYPEHLESEVVSAVQKCLEWTVPLAYGRDLIIPTEALVGWNWAYARNDKKEVVNPDGLEPFGNDLRKRSAEVSILDRRVRDIHR